MKPPLEICARIGRRGEEGSAFIMAMIFLATLAVLVAATLTEVTSRAPVPYQDASHQQARMAAEAGIDSVLDYMNANPAILTTTGTWSGWKQADGTSPAAATGLAIAGAANGKAHISGSSAKIYSGTSMVISTGTAAFVNLSVQAIYPTASNGSAGVPWFVIRSMGTAPVPGPKRNGIDKMDNELRRISLNEVRQNLLNEIASTPTQSQLSTLDSSVPVPPWWKQTPVGPSVSRVIEALVMPTVTSQFGYAMFTDELMTWGNNGKFSTDSWNSDNIADYPGGAIDLTGLLPNARHAKGNIATNSSANSAITTHGGDVYGTVQTPTGAAGIDTTANITPPDGAQKVTTVPKIKMPAAVVPSTSGWSTLASTSVSVSGASEANPTEYYAASLGSITFTGTGYVTIVVAGDWDLGNGSKAKVIVPPGVHAKVYVAGNIDFGNGNVNDPSNSANSGKPTDLLIYGTGDSGTAYSGNGNPVVSAGIYAPNYDVSIKGGGNGTFYGAIIAKSYSNNGGGGLSLHYDEALMNSGDKIPTGYSAKSIFEDNRL